MDTLQLDGMRKNWDCALRLQPGDREIDLGCAVIPIIISIFKLWSCRDIVNIYTCRKYAHACINFMYMYYNKKNIVKPESSSSPPALMLVPY